MSGVDSDGELPRANRAFTADAAGTMVGAVVGTSTVTSYVESATGVEEGGRRRLRTKTSGSCPGSFRTLVTAAA